MYRRKVPSCLGRRPVPDCMLRILYNLSHAVKLASAPPALNQSQAHTHCQRDGLSDRLRDGYLPV